MANSYLYIYYNDMNLENIDELMRIKTLYHNDIHKIELCYGVQIHLFYTGSPFSTYIRLLVIESLDELPKKIINNIFRNLAELPLHNNFFLSFRPFEEYKYIPNIACSPPFTFEDKYNSFYFIGGYYTLDHSLDIDSYISMLILEQLFYDDCSLFQKIRKNGFSYLTVSKFNRKLGRYILGAILEETPNTKNKQFIFNELKNSINQLTIGDLQEAKNRLIDKLYLQHNLHSPVRFLPFIWHLDNHLINLEDVISKINFIDKIYVKEYLSNIKYDILKLYEF